MRNKSGIYKIVAICASVIAALAMLVPTVTSAVGLSAANNSNHNAASAPRSATSTRSASSSSSGSSRSSDTSSGSNEGGWKQLSGRNLQWRYGDKEGGADLCELHLSPVDKTKPVNGNHLLGQDYNGLEHIFSKYQSGSTELVNQIKTIVIDDDMDLSDAEGMFYDFEGVTKITGLQHMKFKGSNDVSLQSMFSKCIKLKELEGIQNWDMSNVTNASFMFDECSSLENIDLSGWQNVNLEDLYSMFEGCTSLNSITLFPAKKLKNLQRVFFNDKKLKNVYNVKSWNTSNVINMYAMFYSTAIESIDLSSWNIPTGSIVNENNSSRPTFGIGEPIYVYMVLNNTLRDLTYVGNFFPHRASGVWRRSSGKSVKNPGENVELTHKAEANYRRIVRDYIGVKFENKTDKKTIKCVADVLQGNNKKYNLGNANFVSCKDESGDAEGSNAFIKDKPIKFETIKNAMGIINGDTVTWDVNEDKLSNYIKEVTDRNNTGTGIYYLASNNKGAKEVTINNGSSVPDSKISEHELVAWKDITFTANVTHKQKPKPPVPTPPKPQPQPTPTPEPGPTPEPAPEPTPTPEPSPESTPDDLDILPDITPKPDLNINSNNNFVHPFNKAPQSVKGDDVQNNKLQHSEINGRARLGVKEYVGGNSGTCKCVCPNLPKDAKSRKSNKSVRKSSNKATPCKSGNNYSWLGIGGLIISWLIMLLIGFIVGYKMRKKRDDNQRQDEHSDENQSVIKDQSL